MKRGFQRPDEQRADSTGKAQARLQASRQGPEAFQFRSETAMTGVRLQFPVTVAGRRLGRFWRSRRVLSGELRLVWTSSGLSRRTLVPSRCPGGTLCEMSRRANGAKTPRRRIEIGDVRTECLLNLEARGAQNVHARAVLIAKIPMGDVDDTPRTTVRTHSRRWLTGRVVRLVQAT
jgi:hypothetical protein